MRAPGTGPRDTPRPPPGAPDLLAHSGWAAQGRGAAMNGRVVHQEEVVRVHVAATTTTTAAGSSANSAPPPPRRAVLVDPRGARITGPLTAEAGGEFTFELIENYPSLGLSAVEDGSGTIINWRGARGPTRVHRYTRRDKDFIDAEHNPSPRTRPTVLDPYLPTFQHLLCDLDLVTSSLHLKNYPVCENDLYDVNSESPRPPTGMSSQCRRFQSCERPQLALCWHS